MIGVTLIQLRTLWRISFNISQFWVEKEEDPDPGDQILTEVLYWLIEVGCLKISHE